MSDQALLQDEKPLTPGKITLIVLVAVIIFLGSVVLLVFGSNRPNDTPGHKTENQAMLGIGTILLIGSIILPAVYFGMKSKTPWFDSSSSATPGLPWQAAQYAYRG